MAAPLRRDLLKLAALAGVVPVLAALPRQALAADRTFAPAPTDWQRFDMRLAVSVPTQGSATELWLPVPGLTTNYQRSIGNRWSGNASTVAVMTDPTSGAQFLHATFQGVDTAQLELTSQFETRNRTINWGQERPVAEDPAILAAALKPSASKPLNGLVLETAQKATAGATTDVEKVRALYRWIVAHCYRNLDVPGCGPGDTVATLTSAGLGGKCADLNGLFVALNRAVGVPARDIYGVRVAPSAFGYKQLGADGASITGAQHCRSEVYLSDYGWVAMDPADVLKVMRAESDRWIKDPKDPLVAQVDAALLGNWEGNWVGYNTAEDVALPGRSGTLPFLMYPQGSIGGRALNELDAKSFHYAISAQSA